MNAKLGRWTSLSRQRVFSSSDCAFGLRQYSLKARVLESDCLHSNIAPSFIFKFTSEFEQVS